MESNSPFEKYFDSDYAPTTAKILEINKLIANRRAIVNDFDTKIAELDRMKKEIEVQRSVAAKCIARHHNFTNAARGLPPDILFTIFQEVHSTSTPPSSPHPSVALSHVCHQWRRLALAMPSLWTRINISTPSPAPHEDETAERWREHLRSSYERAATFIGRAGAHPLYVTMVVQDAFDNSTWMAHDIPFGVLDIEDEVLKCLSQTTHQETGWISLRVNTVTPACLAYIHCLDRFKFTGMLTLDIGYLKAEGVPDAVWEALGNVIPLRGVCSTSLTLRMTVADLRRVDVDWASLTDLTLGPSAGGPSHANYAVRDIIPILVHTTGLVKLSLDLNHNFDQWQGQGPSEPRVRLLTLRTLQIRVNFMPFWFLACLDIPSLTRASLTSYVSLQERDVVHNAMIPFLRQYGHQLTYLEHDCENFGKEVTSCALSLLPNVEFVRLVSSFYPVTPDGASAILDSLIVPCNSTGTEQAESTFLPKLRRLICDLHDATPNVRDGVIGFIEARRSGRAAEDPLRWLDEVEVQFNEGSVDGMLEELRNRGVDTNLVQFNIRSVGGEYFGQYLFA